MLGIATMIVVSLTATSCQMPPPGGWPVMGRSQASASQMAGWFRSKGSGGSATVPVQRLAQYFLDEGAAEGVAGDLAFVQAMLETGWLTFSTRAPAKNNNFSGIGALDAGTASAAFPDARTGVRAQIQHLRAYADAGVRTSKLHHPLVDPRFIHVRRGIAPKWGGFGNGVWATDPHYSIKLAMLQSEMLEWAAKHR